MNCFEPYSHFARDILITCCRVANKIRENYATFSLFGTSAVGWLEPPRCGWGMWGGELVWVVWVSMSMCECGSWAMVADAHSSQVSRQTLFRLLPSYTFCSTQLRYCSFSIIPIFQSQNTQFSPRRGSNCRRAKYTIQIYFKTSGSWRFYGWK